MPQLVNARRGGSPHGLWRYHWKVACFGAAVLAVVCSGCGDACVQLQTICDRCLAPNQRGACEAAVDKGIDAGDDESCAVDIESYQAICQ